MTENIIDMEKSRKRDIEVHECTLMFCCLETWDLICKLFGNNAKFLQNKKHYMQLCSEMVYHSLNNTCNELTYEHREIMDYLNDGVSKVLKGVKK